jgi:HEAT repeat protein
MTNLLEQAQTAAQQENWLLLNQCLQQLLLNREGENAPSQSDPAADAYLKSNSQALLNLALQALEWSDFHNRWEVAKVFPSFGRSAIAPLLTLLQDEEADLEARWFATRILGEFNNPVVVTALINLLKTCDDEELSSMAAEALANMGSPAIAALTNLLAQEKTRYLAVQTLAQIRTTATIDPLLSIATDHQANIRAMAIEALSSFHDPRIPPVLIHALKDPVAIVRKVAVRGLSFRSDLLNEFDLVSLVEPLLLDLNLDVCRQSAIALGRLGTPAAIVILFRGLQSAHTPTSLKLDIIQALAHIEHPESLDCLQQILQSDTQTETDLQIAQAIINALGQVQTDELKPSATQILLTVLQIQHPVLQSSQAKQTLALSLSQLGDRAALEPLLHLLAEPDLAVRLHVIAALKKLAPDAAHQRLHQLANDDTLTPAMKQGVDIALQEWTIEPGQ